MQRIEASLLIPGRGDPIVDGVVLLDGSTITFAGAAADAPSSDGADVTPAAVVMPGLWDCHAHIFGLRTMDFSVIATEPLAVRGARCVGDMRAALDAGVTSVREAATASGPLTLGPQAPLSGQLVAGYAADVITLDADPVADINVLADPDHVIGVWKAGQLVKS